MEAISRLAAAAPGCQKRRVAKISGDRFHCPAGRALEGPVRRRDQQGGGHHEIAAHVPQPPCAPDGADAVGVDLPSSQQAGDPDRRAHGGAHRRGQHHQGEHVSDPLERWPEIGSAQEERPDQRLEGVPDRDPEHRVERHTRPAVGQQRPECDPRPQPVTPEDQCRQGDPGRRPDRGDALCGEGEVETQLGGAVIDRGDPGYPDRVKPPVTVQTPSLGPKSGPAVRTTPSCSPVLRRSPLRCLPVPRTSTGTRTARFAATGWRRWYPHIGHVRDYCVSRATDCSMRSRRSTRSSRRAMRRCSSV